MDYKGNAMASSPSSEAPIQIEPLTKEEEEKRAPYPTLKDIKDNPDYPEDFKKKPIAEMIEKGFRYYKRTIPKTDGDSIYMLLRKGDKDRSLGLWTEEKEGKLFAFHPTLGVYGGVTKPVPWSPERERAGGGVTPYGRGYLTIPIARTAVIPRDFVPSINVIRYFQIIKENGFPGDFSKFINDIVTAHFRKCHGIKLPVLVEGEEEEDQTEEAEEKEVNKPIKKQVEKKVKK